MFFTLIHVISLSAFFKLLLELFVCVSRSIYKLCISSRIYLEMNVYNMFFFYILHIWLGFFIFVIKFRFSKDKEAKIIEYKKWKFPMKFAFIEHNDYSAIMGIFIDEKINCQNFIHIEWRRKNMRSFTSHQCDYYCSRTKLKGNIFHRVHLWFRANIRTKENSFQK